MSAHRSSILTQTIAIGSSTYSRWVFLYICSAICHHITVTIPINHLHIHSTKSLKKCVSSVSHTIITTPIFRIVYLHPTSPSMRISILPSNHLHHARVMYLHTSGSKIRVSILLSHHRALLAVIKDVYLHTLGAMIHVSTLLQHHRNLAIGSTTYPPTGLQFQDLH
jgi:hypothetical protein